MVYHSAFNGEVPGTMQQACGCFLLPFKAGSHCTAAAADARAEADIVDEAISLFRPNAFFQHFEIRGSGDKLLIYLSLFISCCLTRLAASNTSLVEAEQVLCGLAQQSFKGPGDAGFVLAGMLAEPADAREADCMQEYLIEARLEVARRLIHHVYNKDGSLNKWWLAFASRRFLGKTLS